MDAHSYVHIESFEDMDCALLDWRAEVLHKQYKFTRVRIFSPYQLACRLLCLIFALQSYEPVMNYQGRLFAWVRKI